mgnify:CR=1 FL=1
MWPKGKPFEKARVICHRCGKPGYLLAGVNMDELAEVLLVRNLSNGKQQIVSYSSSFGE